MGGPWPTWPTRQRGPWLAEWLRWILDLSSSSFSSSTLSSLFLLFLLFHFNFVTCCLAQTFPYLSKFAQTCANLRKLAQTCANLLKLALISLNLAKFIFMFFVLIKEENEKRPTETRQFGANNDYWVLNNFEQTNP